MLDDLLTREVHSIMCCGYGLQDSGLDQVRSTTCGKKHLILKLSQPLSHQFGTGPEQVLDLRAKMT